MSEQFALAVSIASIRDGDRIDLAADSGECAAIAKRLGLVSLDAFQAHAVLDRDGASVAARGRLKATLKQACVASGEPVPERVCATLGTRYGNYDVDDDGILLISWSNGTNSIVESGWWHQHVGGLEADTEVYGTRGYARIWPEPPSEGEEHVTQPMFTAQMKEFLDAIAEGRKPRPSGEDGLVVMQVVEMAYASAELGPGRSPLRRT